MSSRLNGRRVVLGAVAATFALMVAGCGTSATAAATPKERAACAQLQPAFAALNAWSGGPIPTKTYRRAIATAAHADNTRLRGAITRWMTTVLGATGATPGRDATYATEQCRNIGLPLRLGGSSTSKAHSPPSTAGRARAPNSVTGKTIRLAVERYEFWAKGTEAIVTLSGPVGADNVDPWKLVTDSFTWK